MGAFNKVKYGLTSGVLWGLDTVILGIALTMSPYIGTLEAFAFAAIASSALHDIFCAIWLAIYMGVRGRLKDTWAALRTRSGKVVVLGALLGGPIGMTGYVIAINNIGAGYTAIISAFYPAVGAILSFIILKERMNAKQLIAFACALGGIVATHDNEDRARLTGEQGCHDERTHGRDNAQRGVIACLEFGEHGLQLLRREELTL